MAVFARAWIPGISFMSDCAECVKSSSSTTTNTIPTNTTTKQQYCLCSSSFIRVIVIQGRSLCATGRGEVFLEDVSPPHHKASSVLNLLWAELENPDYWATRAMFSSSINLYLCQCFPAATPWRTRGHSFMLESQNTVWNPTFLCMSQPAFPHSLESSYEGCNMRTWSHLVFSC